MIQSFKLFIITSFFTVGNLIAQNSIPKVQFETIKRIENIGGFADARNADIWLQPNYLPSEKYFIQHYQIRVLKIIKLSKNIVIYMLFVLKM
jgi:hypothetical protein